MQFLQPKVPLPTAGQQAPLITISCVLHDASEAEQLVGKLALHAVGQVPTQAHDSEMQLSLLVSAVPGGDDR